MMLFRGQEVSSISNHPHPPMKMSESMSGRATPSNTDINSKDKKCSEGPEFESTPRPFVTKLENEASNAIG